MRAVHCASRTARPMRTPLVTASADIGRYVSSTSWSRNQDPTPLRPMPLKPFHDKRRRLSVLTYDQKVLNPSSRASGPPRIIRSSKVLRLTLRPPPVSQLLVNVAWALTFPPFTRRSPSEFHAEYWLKFSRRLRNQRFGTSLLN